MSPSNEAPTLDLASAQRTSTNYQSTKMFGLFPKLPPELQANIWKLALPGPRVIKVYLVRSSINNNLIFLPREASSVLFSICKDSRKVALKAMPNKLPCHTANGISYFADEDTIHIANFRLCWNIWRDWRDSETMEKFAEGLLQVKNLVIYDRLPLSTYINALEVIPNVESFIHVHSECMNDEVAAMRFGIEYARVEVVGAEPIVTASGEPMNDECGATALKILNIIVREVRDTAIFRKQPRVAWVEISLSDSIYRITRACE